MSCRVYHLCGTPAGRPSARSRDYSGRLLSIVANSARQARLFAAQARWAANIEHPLGIVEYYIRDHGYRLWDG